MRARPIIPLMIAGVLAAILSADCSTFSFVPSSDAATAEAATRITGGMQRLGASPAKGECYANRIAGLLSEDDRTEAARIIENSNSKDDMREGVLTSRDPIKRAFITAHFGCSLSG